MCWRLLLVLLLGHSTALLAQDSAALRAEQDIRSLEEQERLAVLDENVAALEKIWSDRLVVNNPQNSVSPDRAAVLGLVRKGLLRYSRFDRQIQAVRIHNDIAIVMGAEVVVRRTDRPDSQPTSDRRFTHVWQRTNGSWQLVARHANITPSR